MHWRTLVGDAPAEPTGDGTNDVHRCGDYYIKFPGFAYELDDIPPDLQLIVEHLAYRLYARFGVKVPASFLVHNGTQFGLAVRRVGGPHLGSQLRSRGWDLEQAAVLGTARDLFGGFYVDVLLANWDVVGLTGDNLILGPDGMYRIDPGGALTFRARGDRKGDAFGDDPGELTTMKDPRYGTAGRVFGRMSAAQEHHAAEVFRAVAWPQLQAALEETCREACAEVQKLEQRDREALAGAVLREFEHISRKLKSRYEAVRRALDGDGPIPDRNE
jgi:hypothetical protein